MQGIFKRVAKQNPTPSEPGEHHLASDIELIPA
jgi:hypothetical protein